jgi:nucleoside 2-deoxyribosyltransferase
MIGRMFKVYLAGPEVFLPDAIAIGQRKKRLCAEYGFDGLFPFDNEVAPDDSGTRIDLLIYRANVAMMRHADLGILNLTPFRGPSADVGTAFELGMLAGLGKPVFGYTNEIEDLLSRIKRMQAAQFDAAAKIWRDAAGMTIEDFGNADNLMIDATLAEEGRPVFRHAARPEERFRDLTGFEACLRLAANTLASAAGSRLR